MYILLSFSCKRAQLHELDNYKLKQSFVNNKIKTVNYNEQI